METCMQLILQLLQRVQYDRVILTHSCCAVHAGGLAPRSLPYSARWNAFHIKVAWCVCFQYAWHIHTLHAPVVFGCAPCTACTQWHPIVANLVLKEARLKPIMCRLNRASSRSAGTQQEYAPQAARRKRTLLRAAGTHGMQGASRCL